MTSIAQINENEQREIEGTLRKSFDIRARSDADYHTVAGCPQYVTGYVLFPQNHSTHWSQPEGSALQTTDTEQICPNPLLHPK